MIIAQSTLSHFHITATLLLISKDKQSYIYSHILTLFRLSGGRPKWFALVISTTISAFP